MLEYEKRDAETRSRDFVPEFVFGRWIVYVCAVVNYGLALSFPFAMSVLFVDWQMTFDATRAHTAAVYSTNVSILFGAAIIPGFLIDRFGARFTVLLGSCLACLGCVSSAFATSINFLIVSNGVIGGLGFCFIQLPSMTAVNMASTPRYRSMAVAVCTCWLGVCSIAFPYLYRYLVHHYSWRTTISGIGGMCLQTAVLGFLMTSYVTRPDHDKRTFDEELSIPFVDQSRGTLEPKGKDSCTKLCGEDDKHITNSLCVDVPSEKEIPPFPQFCQHKTGRRNVLSILVCRLRNSKWKFILDSTFILYQVHMCSCMATVFSFIVMMMDFSRTKGFDQDKTGTFFLFLIFITSIIGRLSSGALNLISYLHSITLMGIYGVVISSCLIVLGTVTEYSTIVVFLALLGLGAGGIFAIYPKAILDIDSVNLDIYALALGLVGSIECVFDFLIPVMIGYSVDATGSYTSILHTLGSISMVTSIALILVQGRSTYRTFKRTNRHSDDS